MRRLGREDLASKEQHEIEVTQRYLPQQVAEEELQGIVRAAITSTGATGPKDMGRVISLVMAQVKGRADGSLVSRLVKETLQD